MNRIIPRKKRRAPRKTWVSSIDKVLIEREDITVDM